MRTIIITDRAHRLIAANVRPGAIFRNTSTRRPDGTWSTPVEEDTYARIEEHRAPGESHSDVIERMFAVKDGGGLN